MKVAEKVIVVVGVALCVFIYAFSGTVLPQESSEKPIVEAFGSQSIKLRTVIHVTVTDSGISIRGSKSQISATEAIEFFKELYRHEPNQFDLFVEVASKQIGDPEILIDALLELNVGWKINLLISERSIVSHAGPSVTPPIERIFDYFAENGAWPPVQFFSNFNPSVPPRTPSKNTP